MSATLTLAAQQAALLRALGPQRHGEAFEMLAAQGALAAAGRQAERGLTAYRSNGHALAQRALAGAYPVLVQLLGEDNFAALARSFWMREPPQRGDIAQWGAALAQHVESLPDLVGQELYVPDVARVEWLLHRAATAADARLDTPSLALLARQDPEGLALRLAPGTACLRSRHAVVSVVNAHVSGEPALREAGRRLQQGLCETAVVWREGWQPRVREAWPGEADFIEALQDGRCLADSLRAAPALDFSRWLAPAVQGGLLVGAAVLA